MHTHTRTRKLVDWLAMNASMRWILFYANHTFKSYIVHYIFAWNAATHNLCRPTKNYYMLNQINISQQYIIQYPKTFYDLKALNRANANRQLLRFEELANKMHPFKWLFKHYFMFFFFETHLSDFLNMGKKFRGCSSQEKKISFCDTNEKWELRNKNITQSYITDYYKWHIFTSYLKWFFFLSFLF